MALVAQPPEAAMSDDYDSPWKDILQAHFQDFMTLFFPVAAADIAFARGVEALDKELAQVVQDAELGRRLADKLLRVWLNDGAEAWLLVHIEVQGQREAEFPERMFVYGYRIYDRYRRTVVSLAVLADETPSWRPRRFQVGRWGSRIGIRFPTVKLLDWAGRDAELEASDNVFATVVLAHLATQATRNDPRARFDRKLKLTRRLYERGMPRQTIIDIYRFLDWLMRLPEDLELQYSDAIHQIEEQQKMPYLSFVERRGLERGEEIGEQRGVRRVVRGLLERRFAPLPEDVVARLEQADVDQLMAWSERVAEAPSLEAVFAEREGDG
jgi:hypothetical protein